MNDETYFEWHWYLKKIRLILLGCNVNKFSLNAMKSSLIQVMGQVYTYIRICGYTFTNEFELEVKYKS